MAEQNQSEDMAYGYASDEVKQSAYRFGLNAGVVRLVKFEWIPNGGKDGAEQEALDIVFDINGGERSYRMFPVVKAFDKQNKEVTDRNAPEFRDAVKDFNARVWHIMHCFVDKDTYQSTLARPISSFKDFCKMVQSMLPKDFTERKLDIFLQYQWQISEGQNATFLEIPKKMKYGKWICAAMPGKWKEVRVENPDDSVIEALYYEREDGEIDEITGKVQRHIITKNGWFMNSNFAHQQKTTNATTSSAPATNGAATKPLPETGKAAAW